MKELSTALMVLFNATSGDPAVHNSFYNSIGGRLYFSEAPQNVATYPFSVFSLVSQTHDWNLSADHFREYLVQFTLFSMTGLDATEIDNMYNYCVALFDNCTLSVSSPYTFLYMREENSGPIMRDEDKVWVRPIDFRVLLKAS